MADNTTVNVPNLTEATDAADKAAKALDNLRTSSLQAGDSLNSLDQLAGNARSAFNSFNSMLSSYNTSINVTKALTEKQTTQFGLLSNAIIGTRTSFNSLNGIDTSNLSTFADQITYLTETFTNAKSGIGQLVKFAQDSFGKMVPQAIINQGIGAVKSFVMNLAQSADNALRVQNAYIQLSAKTGNLSAVYETAGPHLKNLNDLLEKQTAMTTNAIKATGLAPEVVQNYYAQLGTVPKALESVVQSSGSASKNISMLTATIKLATGTGRSYSDVIDDLKVAFKDYNITGESALQFTSRMGEISNKFGINLDVVRDSLKSTADTFKMFGNEAEGSAKILNNYVGSLKSTGLSGDAAVEVVTSMTHAVGNLNIAQKAFLSAQTGGPGGLMGGFQIEKMIREGKLDEVFEKVRTQMQKQFGSIATLDEASKSQSAAAQLTKQIMLLKQGPLGQFARTDQEAMRILEGFKSKQEGKGVSDLSNKIVQDNINKGTLIEEKSYTELSRIRGILEGAFETANISNLGFVQKAATIGAGTPLTSLSEAQRKSKENLSLSMGTAATEGGNIAQDYATTIKNKTSTSQTGKRMVDSILELQKMFGDIASSMKAPLDTLQQIVESNKNINNSRELSSLKNETEKAKQQSTVNRDFNTLGTTNRILGLQKIKRPDDNFIQPVVPTNTFDNKSPNKLGDINVHVTGYCLKCKQEIEGGRQAASLNPAGMTI